MELAVLVCMVLLVVVVCLCTAYRILCYVFDSFDQLDRELHRIVLQDALPLHCSSMFASYPNPFPDKKEATLMMTEAEFDTFTAVCRDWDEAVRPCWVPPCYVRRTVDELAHQYVWKGLQDHAINPLPTPTLGITVDGVCLASAKEKSTHQTGKATLPLPGLEKVSNCTVRFV